jgi:hypothetical protein
MYGTTDITRGTFRLTQDNSSVSMAIATTDTDADSINALPPLTITLIARPVASGVGRLVTGSIALPASV